MSAASISPPSAPLPAEASQLYAAMQAHDARFDGRFFVGVTSTGIYCRPVCRVRTPLQRHCRFFAHAAGAEDAGFRPCLRCRPELAPGLSLIDSPQALAQQAARWLDQAAAEGRELDMVSLAARLGVTDRHLRRIFLQAYGVAPLAYLNTRRLLLAKQLLTDTPLRITEVAHASGFGSLRRFNAAFAERYRLNPSALRKTVSEGSPQPAGDSVTVRLGYRPPYDQVAMRRFLADRAISGVEWVGPDAAALQLRRTLRLAHDGSERCGWLALRFDPAKPEVHLQLSTSLVPALGAVLQRARQALDLDADPSLIDPVMATLPRAPAPGLRLAGSWDGFESAVRVILGQQVTVAAARTLTQRLVAALGEPLVTPFEGLDRLFPTPQAIASSSPETLGRLGIVRQRVGALQALAAAMAAGKLDLHRAAPLAPTMAALKALPGIGPWTAQLIAMRVLAWPDAFPETDIAVLRALGTRDPQQALTQAQAWRPWRAYAVIGLWQSLETADD